jgi:hypothetical protein
MLVFAMLVTAPRHEAFNKYLYHNGKFAGACIGDTKHQSFFILSFDYIDYCSPLNGDSTREYASSKVHTDKYLGLFGRFWKL